jgi:hypothetical protein
MTVELKGVEPVDVQNGAIVGYRVDSLVTFVLEQHLSGREQRNRI